MKFDELKKINAKKIAEIKENISKDKNNEELNLKLEIHTRIQELLEKDEGLFFNIDYEEGVAILSYIVGDEEIEKTYKELISAKNFIRLKEQFKI